MCGICGYISRTPITQAQLGAMNESLAHRGPDDKGLWTDRADGWYIGLAQRRLAVQDLSSHGHQPMVSADGSDIIVYNGEIYNFQALRRTLEARGYSYRSNGDTEVLLTAWQEWGENCLDQLEGMFVFAVYNRPTGRLFLARDRVGKKPLYYYADAGTLIFASELKAIRLHPAFHAELRVELISRYLCNLYIESPNTIYQNTCKLEPGCCMTWTDGVLQTRRYYSYLEQFALGAQQPVQHFNQAKDELSALIGDSVAKRMIANVPVGVFLSGGIDSTIVAGTAARIVPKPIRSFTIGFHAKERDEADRARAIAAHIGTEHVELYVEESTLLDLVDDIPRWFDEPHADASQIPTMLVSRLARQDVTVALSGDGGDEFFCGYNLYDWVLRAQRLDGIAGIADRMMRLPGIRPLRRKLPATAQALIANRRADTKVQLFTDVRESFVRDMLQVPVTSAKFPLERDIHTPNWQERRMLLDICTYLPDDVLVKTDRASMKYSLEVRCPLLDPAIAEYSFRLPHAFKYHGGEKKYILKQVAYDLVPPKLLDMPKRGFGVPLAKWLRGPLKPRVRRYTDPAALQKQQIFHHEALLQLVDRVERSNSSIYSGVLWAFVVFQMWYQMYIEDLW